MKKQFFVIMLPFLIGSACAQTLTPEILMSLKRVNEPRLSPDGSKILYQVRTMDVGANTGNTDIYIMDADGKNVKPLANTATNETSAKWIEQGNKIAYLTETGGETQLFEMLPDGGNKTQVTAHKGGITNYGYSKQGNYFWFSADVKLEQNPAEIYPDLPKVNGARIIDGLNYRHWNVWSDYTYSHIFVGRKVGGKLISTNDIMSNERFDAPNKPNDGDEQMAFSADEKYLAYACKKLRGTDYAVSTNTDIYLFDLTANTTTNISSNMPGYDNMPVFAPDNKSILWLSMAEAGYEADRTRLMQCDLATKNTKELLSNFDYSIGKFDFNALGNKIYFIAGVEATDQLFSLDVASKSKNTLRKITNVEADITDLSIATKNKEDKIIVALMRHDLPTEIFNVDLKTGNTLQISAVNKALLSNIKMGKSQKRMVKTSDGKAMLTWVIYPPDFDPAKKYPALLYCQGGPQSTVSQFFSYRWNFELMAANGYIVVAPNRRGLPSFGETWNDAIRNDWGGQAMTDLLSAIDDVANEPYVDKNKLACVGASFGGYSAFWLAGHHNKRFKAFIAHCGVFNLESMYGTTEEIWFTNTDMGGP
ncbi:MAG TPA: prolyl oligopeptidase family serine peptidase, partial [Bacteroidia bacterium]|nr:prolyl oligopeptidase family serine peptidase [Bacteroidia bacterium]